ncbi:enoyl-CoA hydratase [Hydrocarboniphaga sp.]|uniref:enoyl-CoA hydratase n=1 Tax=Hydrocarboniphaga sp. TaxID=2033016 RepID=UPI003D0EAEEE
MTPASDTAAAAAAAVYETDAPVLYAQQDAIAIVSLNRPKFGNAQNAQMLYALDGALRRAASDDSVKVIVLRAEGRHFSSGHDIGTPGSDFATSWPDRRTLWYDHVGTVGAETHYVREQESYLGLCRRWRELPKPMIAAVQGACIAGGLMLAWICDLIVASEDAFFSDPVLKMGVPGVEYFAHAFEMHPRIAREFLYLGERMSAQRAYEIGMVNRLVPLAELHGAAIALAEKAAQSPRFALALAKQIFNQIEDLQGKRAAIDAAFSAHHLAHAHNQLTGDWLGGVRARDVKKT